MTEITGYKRGSQLFFEREGKKIVFDFKDFSFYKPLNKGNFRKLKAGQNFFRNLSVNDVADGFNDPTYRRLMKLVESGTYGRASNFASVFKNLSMYKHLEGYLLLQIPFSGVSTFRKPVNIYPKEVLAFMKESRITFNSNYWEQNFLEHPELITKLCTHVRRRHYLDLEVYQMLYKLASTYKSDIKLFKHLTDPQVKKPRFHTDWRGTVIVDTPYGCEYKTLFDYLVRIDRTEACPFSSALTYYRDYLKMMREMERNKAIARMRETNPNIIENEIGFVGFGRIEKYPKYLRTRHDIVQKNYRDWEDSVDEKLFSLRVERGYDYAWGKYKMIVPRKSDDIRNEGTTQHHCVASYVSRVMDGTTQILFMRENPEESLVTVEVRAGRIVQARGYNNRSVTDEEQKWLKTFAKAKNLSYLDVKKDESMPTPPIVALTKYDPDTARLRSLSVLAAG